MSLSRRCLTCFPPARRWILCGTFRTLPGKEKVRVVTMDLWSVYRQVIESEFPVHVTSSSAEGIARRSFDALIVCAGTGSRRLAAALGDRVNVYPVKGYSITVNLGDRASQAAAPEVSLLDDATKIVTNRLGLNRFRVAGTAEFNGINRDIRADRVKPLLDWVHQCFTEIDTRSVAPWAGLRPMMPDMLSRVGRGKAPQRVLQHGARTLGMDPGGSDRGDGQPGNRRRFAIRANAVRTALDHQGGAGARGAD
ncbi:D-amino acid dehydrogenase small subunit [Variovorax sp. PBL-E5]|nr:D-amino acid dehydrogenase small subunit [Variovorax sp. PBL-E5]